MGGVVDEDVETAERLRCVGDELVAKSLVANVARHGTALRPAARTSSTTSAASGSSTGR